MTAAGAPAGDVDAEVDAGAAVDADVAVLGAGPAGLVAAGRAAQRGHRVVLLERAPHVGGMAASIEVAGQRVDLGSHRLHPATPPAVLDDLRALLGDDLQVRPRNGRILLHGRWVAFPLRTGDLLRHLPLGFAAGATRDALVAPLRRARGDSFGAHLRAGLGPTVTDAFYGPYARKLWGVGPDELDAELARRRVGTRGPLDVVRRLVRGARPEGRTFLYPRLGFGQIGEALDARARAAGVDVRLGAEVTRLRHRDDGWLVRTEAGTVRARTIWSTLPVTVLARLLDPGPPPDVEAAAAGLRHRAMALVYLVVDRDRVTPFDAHYLPGPETAASRVSEPKGYRDGPDPAGRSVLCAEVPCTVGDAVWRLPDDALVERIGDELRAIGLPVGVPVAGHVVRLPHVYPVYDHGATDRLAAVEAWLATHPDLVTFGRPGLFVPDNTHHVLAMGWALAEALGPDGCVDPVAWAAARESFRANVVED